MASFPSSIWAPSDIVDGTVFEAVLVTEAYDEVDAIEAELGLEVHGKAGSLANRIDMFMDPDGEIPYLRLADATDVQRKKSRHGVTTFESDDLDANGVGTLIFAPPLSELDPGKRLVVILTLHIVTDDIASPEQPTQVCDIQGTGTASRFDLVCLNGNGEPPSSGTFIVHWSVFERFFSGEDEVDLDFGAGFARNDGRGPPGLGGEMGVEDGVLLTDSADAFLFEDGNVMLYEGFDSGTDPTPANFMLFEDGNSMIFEHDLPADETFLMGMQ